MNYNNTIVFIKGVFYYMFIVTFLFSLFIFIKTIYYGIYELKTNKNILGGLIIIIISFVILFLPSYMVYIR